MIASVIKSSIKHRTFVLMLAVLLFFGSFLAIKKTPVDAIPDLSDTQVIIQTDYPGQPPQVVEDQVTYPLSTKLLSVPGAQNIRGYSFFGDSYVYVIFDDETDPYWARSRVLEYLNQAKSDLPAKAQPEIGPDATGIGWVYEYALTSPDNQHSIADLTTFQNWFLKFELQTVKGVAEVATVGGMEKQYQIIINPHQLQAYDLTIAQVKQAIQANNQKVGGSVIEMAEAEYMIRTNGYLKNLKSIRRIPVGVLKDGKSILLKDIARVREGPAMRRGVADLNGKGETVGGIVVMRSGANALKTIQAVKDKLNSLKQGLPEGVKLVETYDRSDLINQAVNTLNHKLIQELVIVVLICLLFLFHFRSSLVIVISLPLGVMTACLIMYWQGINANIMSLGGIALAIGAMVDGAIVIIENVHKHLAYHSVKRQDHWAIVQKAAMEVAPSIFFSLLIVTVSFLPVFTLQGESGKLFSPLAFTKTYAMAVAAGLSVTLVPVLAGLLVRGQIRSEHQNPITRLLVLIYRPCLQGVLKWPKSTLLLSFLILIATLWPFRQLGYEFMPSLNEGDLMYMPMLDPGVSIGKARQLLQQTDRLIKTVPEVKRVFGKAGRAQTATDPAPLTMIETMIQLKPKRQWRDGMTIEKIKKRLDEKVDLPGVTNTWGMPIRTRIDMLSTGVKTPLGIKVKGDDLGKLQELTTRIKKLLTKLDGTKSAYADKPKKGRYINVDINRQQAAAYGLDIADIQNVIALAVGGATITQTVEGLKRFPVNLRFPAHTRDSVDKLKKLPLVTPSEIHVPLNAVADVKITEGPAMIKSENGRLTAWVMVEPATDIGRYIPQIKQLLNDKLTLPPGYAIKYAGQYQSWQKSKKQLKTMIPVTLMLIVLLLYLCFQRLLDVAIIMCCVPFSLVGGIWLLYWLGFNFSIAVAVGFIALAGVAIETGVLMVVYLNQSVIGNDCCDRASIKTAVQSAALARVRPIVMTAIAVIAGLLPILFGSGIGIRVMERIAAPMIGGMTSVIIMTLLVLPAIYILRYRFKHAKHSEITKSIE